jgi:hypothetical protein
MKLHVFFCDQRLLAVMSLAFGSLVSSRPSWHRLKLNLSPAAAAAWIPTNGQPSKEWTPWPRAHQRPNVKSLDIVDLSRLSTQMTNQLDVLSSWFLSKFRSYKLVDLVWSCHIYFMFPKTWFFEGPSASILLWSGPSMLWQGASDGADRQEHLDDRRLGCRSGVVFMFAIYDIYIYRNLMESL